MILLLAACGTPEEDYRARFLDRRWEDLRSLDARRFCAQLARYVEGKDPIYPDSDPRFLDLFRFLRRVAPDPAGLLPLLGPRGAAREVDAALLKRDALALAVVDSFLARYAEGDAEKAALLDAALEAAVHFSFDPVYEESHTRTGEEIADFLSTTPAAPEVRDALSRRLEPLLGRWRARVTPKSTSTFFGIVLRHLGDAGALRLLREWEGMREEERIDLLERLARLEEASRATLLGVLDRATDPSLDVRDSALRALARQGAPVGDLDGSAREEALRAALPGLRRWIEEKKP